MTTVTGPALWRRRVGSTVVPANQGQSLDVLVTPDDGLEHDAKVTVRVSVVERIPPVQSEGS
jgi:hypothetical protein